MTSAIRVERLLLAEVVFPEWHPRFVDGSCPVFAYAVCHPDGVIIFDTGIGSDNSFINDLYKPKVVPIVAALASLRIDERDVVAVVNSHLHFDHCGQNTVFHERGIPTYVQAAEIEVSQEFGYTVPEWATIPEASLRVVRGDEIIAVGVKIIETPGHTPGHQSLVVTTAAGFVVVAGQCVYNARECTVHRVAVDNMHDDEHLSVGQQSLDRVLSVNPRCVAMSHDPTLWSPTGAS